jgi:ketosteroid isomerase-like protein
MSTSTVVRTPTAVVHEAYQAFGRRDVPALLDLMADDVDWEFVGSAGLAYAGRRKNKEGVADFFAGVAKLDDIHVFEPREFIEAGEHVTVLGWERSTAIDTGHEFESEWVHVFTVKNGKVTRWRGFFNTAARYGK